MKPCIHLNGTSPMTPEIKTAVEALLNDTRVKLTSVRVRARSPRRSMPGWIRTRC